MSMLYLKCLTIVLFCRSLLYCTFLFCCRLGASDLYDAGHGHVYAEKIQPLPDNLKKKVLYGLYKILTDVIAQISADTIDHYISRGLCLNQTNLCIHLLYFLVDFGHS
jgi:hypothetical protein